MNDIRERQKALIERFNLMRESGICSPTTRSLLDDAQCLLAEAVGEYLEAEQELRDRELHHFESEKAMVDALNVLNAGSVPLGMSEANFNGSIMRKAREILREAAR